MAGAAILAGAAASAKADTSRSQAGDLAFAVPRLAPHFSGAPLIEPLPGVEADRLRRIFAFQRRGDLRSAQAELARFDRNLEVAGVRLGVAMTGHVLADRYLGPYTRPAPDLLTAWLADHSDLPDAAAIHALLSARLPRGQKPPVLPLLPILAREDRSTVPVPEESEPPSHALLRNADLDHSVHAAARGKPGAAARLIARTSGLSSDYASQLMGESAQILFTLGRDAEAYELGWRGATLCRRDPTKDCRSSSLAGYAAGLAAWRLGRHMAARPMFEAAWRAELTTPALRAASAFWAARSHTLAGDAVNYAPWMSRAGAERSTFYGFLARRALGLGYGFAPGGRDDREILTVADVDAIADHPEGLRAFALLQIGEDARAEAEFRLLWPAVRNKPALGRAIMLVAEQAGLVDLAAQLADLVQTADGRPRDTMRFPVPRLQPRGGFTIDPAMVFGLARTESNFDAAMVSTAGARGLMQIMPETASFILGPSHAGRIAQRLHDPEINLELGQRYVSYLATCEGVDSDLIRLLASYNSGPGNFAHWGPTVRDNGDPLLFIEAIPIDETRAFVPRVLTYTWIYAARLHLPAPSLDELAAGAWPRYHPISTMTAPPARIH